MPRILGRMCVLRSVAACLLAMVPIAACAAGQAHRADPDCARGWPLNMAIVELKNAGLLDPAQLDESKTTSTRVASEARPRGLYHQVYRIQLVARSGQAFELIAIADASRDECSMGDVTVYVVARKLP